MKVSEIMSRPVITVMADTGIKEAACLLAELGVSVLPVVDAKGRLVGIVSEADLLTTGKTPRSVIEVMTREVLTVSANSEVSQATWTMIDAGVKRVPVLRGHRLVGILSRRDLVSVIARSGHDHGPARRLAESVRTAHAVA